jgi:phosphatidylglycerophosphate synthase
MTVATTVGETKTNGVPAGTGKPRELEDFLNRWLFHPLSRRLALLLAPTFVTPNMVSVLGGLLVLGAGFVYAGYAGLDGGAAVAVGLTLHLLWHVVDGADGALARLTGRATPFGEMVDGLCDYSSHALLYVILATTADDHVGWWIWPLGLAAGLSRVAQANHAESERRIYQWRAYGVPWLQQAKAEDQALFRGGPAKRFLAGLTSVYIWLANALSPAAPALDRAAEAATRDPALRHRLTRLARIAYRRPLLLQSLLGANWRTLLLGLCIFLGSPLWYFLIEATLLNLLLLASIGSTKHANACLGARLAAN